MFNSQDCVTNLEFEDIKSLFLNSASPASDPDAYLKCVYTLVWKFFEIYRKSETKLVVNTCGWVEGQGALLANQICKFFSFGDPLFVTMTSTK